MKCWSITFKVSSNQWVYHRHADFEISVRQLKVKDQKTVKNVCQKFILEVCNGSIYLKLISINGEFIHGHDWNDLRRDYREIRESRSDIQEILQLERKEDGPAKETPKDYAVG
jgi:hypothetical protein